MNQRKYIDEFWWNESVFLMHKNVKYESIETIRAMIPIVFDESYVDQERQKQFYLENWAKWISDKPSWFISKEFTDNVQINLIPK